SDGLSPHAETPLSIDFPFAQLLPVVPLLICGEPLAVRRRSVMPLEKPSDEGMVAGQGVRLHYREWGGPARASEAHVPIVLLHGLASTAHIWDLVAPFLSQERRVVALDQRGHGLSDKPDEGYDFATIVADDFSALDHLYIGDRFIVTGHS